MAYKGKFRVKNIEKYKGDASKVVYRSSWEARFFKTCDDHPDIVEWASETIIIPYYSKVENKWRRYFPDVWMRKRAEDGTIETLLIEIKPDAQTRPPNPANRNKTKTGRVSRRYLNEVKTYGTNVSKWEAAEKYCQERGWKFVIMTEKVLFK